MAAAAKKTASSYYQWSDDEKRRYYTEFEAVPRNSREAWLKEHWPGNRSQFYRNRTAFLKTHRDFELGPTSLDGIVRTKKRLQTVRKQKKDPLRERQLAQAAHAREVLAEKRAAAKKLPPVRMTSDFRAADKAGKRSLMEEYLALHDSAKRAFREQHNMSQALVNYYSKKRSALESSKALVPASNFHAQILPAPPRDIPSLDDAITAMEVERDQLSAFIERLKRFRNVR